MKKLLPLLWLVIPLGFAIAAWPVSAQQAICAERMGVVSELAEKYSENQKNIGIANNGEVLEVFVSPKGNTWTIVVTDAAGITCLIAAGESWETVPIKIRGPKL